ncbi:MAG: potassium channel family protein [Pyrinomonadaceae bacterium]
MNLLGIAAGIVIIVIILWDAFEAIVLPRRVTRRVRLTTLFYRLTWTPWQWLARHIKQNKQREKLLGFFGPLSLIFLLSVWAVGLVIAFGLIQWSISSGLASAHPFDSLGLSLYFSGSTFFTLGLGDVTPGTAGGRIVTVLESGIGIGFLALVIGYLPVLYQAFSRREVNISLLDARAGTPPTATELLRRHHEAGNMQALEQLLGDWEKWAADLMESHLSYQVLCYFRSQHDNQSWVAALTTILDACALVMVGVDGAPTFQAQLTFKMARHAVVDLAQTFNATPLPPKRDRLDEGDLTGLRAFLADAGLTLRDGAEADENLIALRRMYEPYVNALAEELLMPLPPWMQKGKAVDNWQTSAWERNPATSATTVRKCTMKNKAGEPLHAAKMHSDVSLQGKRAN